MHFLDFFLYKTSFLHLVAGLAIGCNHINLWIFIFFCYGIPHARAAETRDSQIQCFPKHFFPKPRQTDVTTSAVDVASLDKDFGQMSSTEVREVCCNQGWQSESLEDLRWALSVVKTRGFAFEVGWVGIKEHCNPCFPKPKHHCKSSCFQHAWAFCSRAPGKVQC